MKHTLRFFGIPVFSLTSEDPELEKLIIQQLGGQFELALQEAEEEYDEDDYEDRNSFGFGRLR